MPAVLTTEDLKLLVGVLSQYAPDNKTFPPPNHSELAKTLGFDTRIACKNKWGILTRKIRNGDYGDMGDIIVDRDPKEAEDKKRPAVEVPVGADEPMLSSPKKAKGVKKAGKGKSKEKAVKAENNEQDWDDDQV
ncbi:hypothetical protein OCU04_002402 [Sclerotinia nivalis]|uniref:Uncharacterized protein n=1 Tax=Sclerotinia nivalis TaxID=352851 RepID=A0A9X0DQ52_9HELO|nr:hypothetical protein OCU04_002402 [Sclerotinia nivalis]